MQVESKIIESKGLKWIIRCPEDDDALELSKLRIKIDNETEFLDREEGEGVLSEAVLREHHGSNFIVDARNGFEDEKEDVEWGFSVLLPEMSTTDCEYVIFIMNEVNDIEEEMDMWTKEFMKYFNVKKVESYDQGKKLIIK